MSGTRTRKRKKEEGGRRKYGEGKSRALQTVMSGESSGAQRQKERKIPLSQTCARTCCDPKSVPLSSGLERGNATLAATDNIGWGAVYGTKRRESKRNGEEERGEGGEMEFVSVQ